MAYTPISGAPLQYHTNANELASGYYLKFYEGITTTPLSMATDSAAGTLLVKCKLNTRGEPITDVGNDNSVFIPYLDQSYRIVLYKNETDADNNTTGSAEFNVGGVALNIAPSANAADIALRNVTLLEQDDYDRSPLFVDVTDFTAGAGPHVITVPSGWTPTDTDMRFYKLDASGIVTPLSPTAKTATTFTIADTLLTTDVLYIGDDNFREFNLRIDTFAGFTAVTRPYFAPNISILGAINSISAVLATGLKTVGPTGSGADYENPLSDGIIDGTIYLDSILTIKLQSVAIADVVDKQLFIYSEDSAGAVATLRVIYTAQSVTDKAEMSLPVKIPVNSNKIYNVFWAENGTGAGFGTATYSITTRGFGL